MGSLAAEKPEHGKPLSGILIKRGFNYHLIAPEDLQSECVYTVRFGKKKKTRALYFSKARFEGLITSAYKFRGPFQVDWAS